LRSVFVCCEIKVNFYKDVSDNDTVYGEVCMVADFTHTPYVSSRHTQAPYAPDHSK